MTPTPSQITDPHAILAFITAGNATFTLRSLKTGVRYTFKVQQGEGENGAKQDRWFVKYLTGSDNESDYSYLGMVRDGKFTLTAKSKLAWTSTPVVAFNWAFERLQSGQTLPNTEFWHAGKCGRCGRKLTVPESVSSGYGPECIQHVGVAA